MHLSELLLIHFKEVLLMHISEMLLMSIPKVHFHGEVRKIFIWIPIL